MFRVISLSLVLAFVAQAANIDESGLKRGAHGLGNDGVSSFEALGGFHKPNCVDGSSCDLALRSFETEVECGIACADDAACLCAFFRASDKSCSLKKLRCWDDTLGVTTDYDDDYKTIIVTHPGNPSTLPTVTQASSMNYTGQFTVAAREDGVLPEDVSPEVSSSPDASPSPSADSPSPTDASPSPADDSPSPADASPSPADASPSPDAAPAGPAPTTVADTSSTFVQDGATKYSTMTNFGGFGIPYGGCGVPESEMVDANGRKYPFVALNKFTPDGAGIGMFGEGANCGRWIEISVGDPCGTPNDGSNLHPCIDNFVPTEGIIYGYVADSCADSNYWCRTDANHIDMSRAYAEEVLPASKGNWQNNRIAWKFIDHTPPGFTMSNIGVLWAAKTKLDWQVIIITHTDNGISRVEAKMADGTWQDGAQQYLAHHFSLPASNLIGKDADGHYTVRAYDLDGKSYGEFAITLPPGEHVLTPTNGLVKRLA